MIETTDFSSLYSHTQTRSVLYSTSKLNLYQRLIQYFSAVVEYRGEYLDLINFNRNIFPSVLPISQSEALFDPEHGYACPDGSVEVGELIRAYEACRTGRFLKCIDGNARIGVDFEKMAVGIGAGTTGVVNCLIPAIRDYHSSKHNDKKRTIVLTVPLYSVYDGIVREHNLEPQYLLTTRQTKFLPTPDEVQQALLKRPMALILTFPTNPAQTTYDRSRWEELKAIAQLCQETETFLICDNIYQDTLWHQATYNPEIFALVDSTDFIIKVFGPSKDRPGCSGFRIGHYCGDSRVRESFFYYSSIQYNTPNSSARCLLALDLLFRLLLIEHRPLTKEDLMLLGDHLAGWNRPLNRDKVFERIHSSNLFETYSTELGQVEQRQRNVNSYLRSFVQDLEGFSDVVNDVIGNVLLVRINEHCFPGTCHELFLYVLKETGLGILPGNSFGFPLAAGNAWFRFTTIHDTSENIARNLWRVNEAVKCWKDRGQ